MKILHTTRGLLKRGGGPAYTVPSLASAQARNGADVTILLDEEEFDYEAPPDVSRTLHRSQLQMKLSTFVGQFDLVHDHGFWLPCNHRIAAASRSINVPRVISPRGAIQAWIWKQRRWKKFLGWILYQRRDLRTASAVFATASIEGDRVKELGFKGPIIDLPNGVDPPGQILSTRKAKRCALFLSRIHPKKGVQELVDAWIEIAPVGWFLVIAGPDEGGLIPSLSKQIQDCGKVLDVRFPGILLGDQKSHAFNDADLFVLPTYSENFGVSVIEAMLMRLPVITTTETPWHQIEVLGQGWLIETGKIKLTECLRKATLLTSDELRSKGERAKAWAEGRFSWNQIAIDSLANYEQILSGQRFRSLHREEIP